LWRARATCAQGSERRFDGFDRLSRRAVAFDRLSRRAVAFDKLSRRAVAFDSLTDPSGRAGGARYSSLRAIIRNTQYATQEIST